jgi:hypothetical protein
MASKKHPFTGLLRKPIDLGEAPARSLRAALALPPDENDRLAYAKTQLRARWKSLDEFFELNSRAADIWERRAKAVIERRFGISSSGRRWWKNLAELTCH